MRLVLTYAFSSTFDQSDALKLLGIVGAMVALYIVARRLGGGDEAIPPPSETPVPIESQRSQTLMAPHAEGAEAEDPDQPEYEAEQSPEPEKSQPRNIRITNWNFEHFDIATGPPDPDSFADDLWMELYDSSSGHAWKQTRFVATPAGLTEMLRKEKWSSMLIPQALVMSRYDVKELRAAILDDLGAMEEQRGDVTDDDRDAAAAAGGSLNG